MEKFSEFMEREDNVFLLAIVSCGVVTCFPLSTVPYINFILLSVVFPIISINTWKFICWVTRPQLTKLRNKRRISEDLDYQIYLHRLSEDEKNDLKAAEEIAQIVKKLSTKQKQVLCNILKSDKRFN